MTDYNFTAAKRTGNVKLLVYGLCAVALGVVCTGVEHTVSSAAYNHARTADLALYVVGCRLWSVVAFVFFHGVAVLVKGLCVFAGRVVGAGGEFSESSAFNHHFTAALFADNVCFYNGKLVVFVFNCLLCLFHLSVKV